MLTSNSTHNRNVAESKLAMQIMALIEHYKQKDPKGLPNAPIPDPFPVKNYFDDKNYYFFFK